MIGIGQVSEIKNKTNEAVSYLVAARVDGRADLGAIEQPGVDAEEADQ
jgi:hypothetical protein